MEKTSSGEVTALNVNLNYDHFLDTNRIPWALANKGIAAPKIEIACELGFGQGLSTNFHAATSDAVWWGNDFNPSQAAFAQSLGHLTGAKLFDESFQEFCNRSDLPDFDFIALHNIWSCLSDENRTIVRDFLRRKLKVGGVVYISYNTLPGWSTSAPMRQLMLAYQKGMPAAGIGALKRIDQTLASLSDFQKLKLGWMQHNSAIGEKITKRGKLPKNYIAHEYLNRDWKPQYFTDVNSELSEAKLNFAASANFLDHIDAINMTAEQKAYLATLTDPVLQQFIRDLIVNQQFRKDYWMKGAKKLNALETAMMIRSQAVCLTMPVDDVPKTIKSGVGEVTLTERIYGPILELLANHKPKTLGLIEERLASKGIALAHVNEALMILAGQGAVVSAQQASDSTKMRTKALNQHLIERAKGGDETGFLGSPVTGGAVPVGRFEKMFGEMAAQNNDKPAGIGNSVWQILSSQGQKLVKEGKIIETPELNLHELTQQAKNFVDKRLPVLKALEVF